jgi:hypothetical protein
MQPIWRFRLALPIRCLWNDNGITASRNRMHHGIDNGITEPNAIVKSFVFDCQGQLLIQIVLYYHSRFETFDIFKSLFAY